MKKCRSKITSSVDPRGFVLSYLIQESVITTKQSKEIDIPAEKEDRCQRLLTTLFSDNHPRAFVSFRNSLLKEYEWLVEEIDQTPAVEG